MYIAYKLLQDRIYINLEPTNAWHAKKQESTFSKQRCLEYLLSRTCVTETDITAASLNAFAYVNVSHVPNHVSAHHKSTDLRVELTCQQSIVWS